jgi:hypothetical protein
VAKAEILIDEHLTISERYRIELKAYKVNVSSKYPEGVKVRFVLVDIVAGKPRILVDNHSPYGFHAHSRLPADRSSRVSLGTIDYLEALQEFHRLVAEVLEQ